MSDRVGERRLAEVNGGASIPLLKCTIGERLRETAARFPDRPALLWAEGDGIGRLSYAQLLAESEQIAAWILELANPGDRIAVWSCNTLEWILLEYGCALSGTVVAAWNTAWTDTECVYARDLSEPRLILAGSDVRGVDLLERARTLGAVGTVYDLSALRRRASSAHRRAVPRVAPDDIFLIQFTSGTTGRPKGACLSQIAGLNAAWVRARLYAADEHDVWLNPVPMNHVGGAIAMVLGAMVAGGAYVIMHRFEVGEFIRMMLACGATRIGGVPTMLAAALDHPTWRAGQRLRSVGMGGAQVSQALIERVRTECGAPVLVVYGQSECPIITSTVPDDDPRLALETVGHVAPNVELRICHPRTGRLLCVGEVGEICVRSPMMMNGYHHMGDATAAVIEPDGFLHTGDIGSVDGRGYVRIHGRARDIIIRGGENIYPTEVEHVMLQHQAIAAIAVVAIPDERWGQQVGAAVVLRDGASATLQELEAFARTRLAHFKVPSRWRLERSLPLTASGKILKVNVEKLFVPQNG